MDVDPLRLTLGPPHFAVILIQANDFLLLAIDADHRITGCRVLGCGVVDVAELLVAVLVLGAFQRLGVALQAVPGLMQQPLDQRRRHPEPLGSQLNRQGPQRLRRPPQRRHRITTRLRLHQGIQRLHQTRLQHLRALTPPTRGPRPVNLHRLRVIQLITAPTHRIARNPCSRSNNRHPAAPELTSLHTQPNPTLTLTQMRLHKVVPTHQGLSNRAHSAKIVIMHPESYIILLQSLTLLKPPGFRHDWNSAPDRSESTCTQWFSTPTATACNGAWATRCSNTHEPCAHWESSVGGRLSLPRPR